MSHKFEKDIDWFVKNIESRKRLLPTFAHAAGMLTKELDKNMDKFVDEHAYDKVYDEEGNLTEFGVPPEYAGRYSLLRKTHHHALIFAGLLPKMTLVSLVSLFDAFLAKIIRNIYAVKPEILNGSEKTLKFSELMEFESLEDARESVINMEIESILRDSHTDQFKWLEEKLKIPLRDLDSWKDFIELTGRRNLFVHTDGVVSKQYISVCKSAGYKLEDSVKVNSRLHVDQEYYDRACDCIAEIGVKLAQVVWRKLCPKETEAADDSLISVVYNFLVTREYSLALTLCKLSEIPAFKASDLEHTYYLKINQAIALKGLNNNEGLMAIIGSIDWSVLSEKFKLAASVLKEDWEDSYKLMIKIGPNGDITKGHYREWPLFREFRKTQQFRDGYQVVFGEEYKIIGKSDDQEGDSQEDENDEQAA
jgi:hypothetical protein